MRSAHFGRLAVSALAATILFSAPGKAEPLALNEPDGLFPNPALIFQQLFNPASQADAGPSAAAPDAQRYPQYQREDWRQGNDQDLNQGLNQDQRYLAPENDAARPENLRRQIVAYNTAEPPGTIIIDTPHTYLYYVLGQGRAVRYGIGVGRDGFTWSGVESIARKQEWPDWHPPAEMIARQPYLPRFMAGGPANPLGARAMYLGNTLYRIHGTNDPSTIGKHVSSGCIRLTNEDIIDLYNRTSLGAKVVVLPDPTYRAQRGAPKLGQNLSERARQSYASVPRSVAAAPVPARSPQPAAPEATDTSLAYGSFASRLY